MAAEIAPTARPTYEDCDALFFVYSDLDRNPTATREDKVAARTAYCMAVNARKGTVFTEADIAGMKASMARPSTNPGSDIVFESEYRAAIAI